MVCKNKREVFGAIKDRVWQKVQGWKAKTLSVGGKEVLLKASAQVVPTYAMSLFQLPFSLCKEFRV